MFHVLTVTFMFNVTNLHHAYICEGEKDSIFPSICSFLENDLKFATKANPDFVYEEWDKFLISHARRLQEMQLNKTTNSGRKIFIISFNFITREAQNALLKVLEEPTSGTHFFFITPSAHVFLDTVLSRIQLISDFKQKVNINVNKSINKSININKDKYKAEEEKFLNAKLGERMKIVAKIVQDIKDEKATKADALKLVRNVIRLCHQKQKTVASLKSLKEAEKVSDYLYDNSASVKTLLEYFALVI